MALSLSIIIIAALLASVALFFLLGSSLPDKKKHNLLLIMGGLVFLSLLISTFKSQQIFTFSLLGNSGLSKISGIFNSPPSPLSPKFPMEFPGALGEGLRDRNFGGITMGKGAWVILGSAKGLGGSYGVWQFAQYLHSLKLPVLYLRMQGYGNVLQEFKTKTGLNSYEEFKQSLLYLLELKKTPYIVIDNAQILPEKFWEVISSLPQDCGVSLIAMSENLSQLVQKMMQGDKSLTQYSGGMAYGQGIGGIGGIGEARGVGESGGFLDRFQVRDFEGFQQGDFGKVGEVKGLGTLPKKIPLTFENIYHLQNGLSEEEILMRSSSNSVAVANYFNFGNSYNTVRRFIEKERNRVSVPLWKLVQNNIPLSTLTGMNKLGLIRINNGEISIN